MSRACIDKQYGFPDCNMSEHQELIGNQGIIANMTENLQQNVGSFSEEVKNNFTKLFSLLDTQSQNNQDINSTKDQFYKDNRQNNAYSNIISVPNITLLFTVAIFALLLYNTFCKKSNHKPRKHDNRKLPYDRINLMESGNNIEEINKSSSSLPSYNSAK